MLNPGLRTLVGFLEGVKRGAPVSFSGLCVGGRRGYGMVGRYLRFCLDRGLIWVVEVRKGRRYPSRLYALTGRGERLLEIFEDVAL